MTQPSIIMASGTPRDRPSIVPRVSDAEWGILSVAGAGFLALGLMDLGLVWFPSGFGSPEWEFGSVTATLNGLPVPALGATMVLAASVARRKRLAVGIVAAFLVILALLVIGAAVLYATTVPIAFSKVTNEAVRTGLFKAAAKTGLQALVYPIVFFVVAFKAWKAVKPASSR
jgi:hypothetical protein